jgi:hypothetical protein
MSQLKDVGAILRRYFQAYGGWLALITSPYGYAALILTILCTGIWLKDQQASNLVVQIIPNLLGFSIGAFAILTASVQGRLGKLLFQKLEGSETSIIEVVASTFLHFIVIQTLALTCAVLGLSQLGRNVGALLTAWGAGHFTMMTLHAASLAYRFVSFFLFAYALMLIVAAAVALFRTLGWEALVSEDEDRRGGGPGPSAK